jgi:HAD superfamily hydrolase (TIGR01459 family)
MTNRVSIVSGLREIAAGHDALICDVWGVLHDGSRVHSKAADALVRFRDGFGPVVLVSNAPRPVAALLEQFAKLGVPEGCYDAIVTSGAAAHDDLAQRTRDGRLAIYHLGPERDRGIFEDLPVDCVDVARAQIVLCTGLFDDDTETPDDYRELLLACKARGLTLLCANPDIVVQRGGVLVYCAGAIARDYEKIGGEVIYFGKPYAPIYRTVLDVARCCAGREIVRPLAIGDGMETDIRGAANMGIEALYIAHGIHRSEIGDVTAQSLGRFFDKAGLWPRSAMRDLVW